jgi:hypothetical protein
MTDEPAQIETAPARSPTKEEIYYDELERKDPVDTTKRIEETAKFLLGITAGTSGFYLSAVKLTMGKTATAGFFTLLPFLIWAGAMIALILVIFPQKYSTYKHEPASVKQAILLARDRKYRRLVLGTLLFMMGIISGAWAFN